MTLTRRTLLLALGGTCALLAAGLLYLIVAPLPDLEIPQQTLKHAAPRMLETMAIAIPPSEAFADINARPMFSADRKPIPPSASAGATGETPPAITLVGVILDSQDKMALIRTPNSPFAGAFHLGSDISGWRVTEIAADRVVLSAGPLRDEVRLENNHASKPNAAPPPMAAQ